MWFVFGVQSSMNEIDESPSEAPAPPLPQPAAAKSRPNPNVSAVMLRIIAVSRARQCSMADACVVIRWFDGPDTRGVV